MTRWESDSRSWGLDEVKLLYDATLPQSLEREAPPWAELIRWKGRDEGDLEVVQAAANQGCRGVIFFERDSLEQSAVQDLARDKGVALVAVEAQDPIKGMRRILRNLRGLQSVLSNHDCILVMAKSVRPISR